MGRSTPSLETTVCDPVKVLLIGGEPNLSARIGKMLERGTPTLTSALSRVDRLSAGMQHLRENG